MQLALINVVVPGSGLVLRDRLAAGTPLLVVALLAAVLVLCAGFVATVDFAGQLRLLAVLAYVLAAGLAGGLWLLWERVQPVDQGQLAADYRAIAVAYLQDDPQALPLAEALCAQAPQVSGAWRLLEMVATGLGKPTRAHDAAGRAQRLEQQAAEAESG